MTDVSKHNAEVDEMLGRERAVMRAFKAATDELDKLDGEQRRRVLKACMMLYGESRLVAP